MTPWSCQLKYMLRTPVKSYYSKLLMSGRLAWKTTTIWSNYSEYSFISEPVNIGTLHMSGRK